MIVSKGRTVRGKDDYLEAQRQFWNVDEAAARFGRVDTVSMSERQYDLLAQRDLDLVLKDIVWRPSWTVVEIGCGVGRLLSRLMLRVDVAKIIGVDISENMIRYAGNALKQCVGVELHVTSGSDVRMIESASVEFVYCNDVLIHVHDLSVVRCYFQEVSRILKVGGVFRFNTRRLDVNSTFANSFGGTVAKVSYRLGILSPLSSSNPESGFSGIAFRQRDIRKLSAWAGLAVTGVERFDGPDERKLWCTCIKHR